MFAVMNTCDFSCLQTDVTILSFWCLVVLAVKLKCFYQKERNVALKCSETFYDFSSSVLSSLMGLATEIELCRYLCKCGSFLM